MAKHFTFYDLTLADVRAFELGDLVDNGRRSGIIEAIEIEPLDNGTRARWVARIKVLNVGHFRQWYNAKGDPIGS